MSGKYGQKSNPDRPVSSLVTVLTEHQNYITVTLRHCYISSWSQVNLRADVSWEELPWEQLRFTSCMQCRLHIAT